MLLLPRPRLIPVPYLNLIKTFDNESYLKLTWGSGVRLLRAHFVQCSDFYSNTLNLSKYVNVHISLHLSKFLSQISQIKWIDLCFFSSLSFSSFENNYLLLRYFLLVVILSMPPAYLSFTHTHTHTHTHTYTLFLVCKRIISTKYREKERER